MKMVLAFALVLFSFGVEAAAPKTLPDSQQKLKNVNGKTVTLADFKGQKGTLVVFGCNSCPYMKAWMDRIAEVGNDAQSKGFGVVMINSNDPKVNAEDGLKPMKDIHENKGMKFPYVVDETSDMARLFGANRTPEAYLFNSQGQLVYHGAIDDSQDPDEVEVKFLADAVNRVAKGQMPAQAETKSIGCTIKFRGKKS